MAEQDNQDSTQQPTEQAQPEPSQKKKRNRILLLIALVFIVLGVAWFLYYFFIGQFEESTDDAYVTGNSIVISPLTNGTVVDVNADNTDLVRAGQVVVRLNPVDAHIQLMQAEGQLAQAVRNARQSLYQSHQADAALTQREVQYRLQRENLARRAPLLDQHAVSPEEVQSYRRQLQGDAAAVKQAKAQAAAEHAVVGDGDINSFPAVIQARAQFRDAWVNNVRSAIVSPVTGYVAQRNVQVGQRVQQGQNLMTVTPLDHVWVDANFKETQLENLRLGQPVTLTTDMYSGVTFHGKVAGLTPGTGSAFSALPAENATGNWVKVVQRLAVRVNLDPDELKKHPLRIGLSTSARVDTSDRDGPVLPQEPRSRPASSTSVYEKELADADQAAAAIIARNDGHQEGDESNEAKKKAAHQGGR